MITLQVYGLGKRVTRFRFFRITFVALVALSVTWYFFIYDQPCPATMTALPGYTYPRRYQHSEYVINHPLECGADADIQLVILVMSAPDNFEDRRAIRRTWGSVVEFDTTVRLLFLLGRSTSGSIQEKVVQEDVIFCDIVQENFIDSYSNLTLKSVMMVKWLTTFCPLARFALKIDDDCFLHPFNLMTFLKSPKVTAAPTAAIFGDLYTRSGYLRPHRCPGDKWFVTMEEFDGDRFPPFLDGVSYLVRQAAIPRLYDAALHRPLIRLEDVFLTGLCADDADVVLIHEVNIGLNRLHPSECVFLWHSGLISYHHLSRQQSERLWRQVVEPDYDPCQK